MAELPVNNQSQITNSIDFLKLSEKWIRITNIIEEHEKNPRDFGTGDLLYCSEIHTIMAIGKNPGMSITNLSQHLGISKSAISQMVRRLERKELVEKYRYSDNEKTILLRLTPQGNIAYLGHEQHHAKILALMQKKLGEITVEKFDLIMRFLSAIEESFEEFGREGS